MSTFYTPLNSPPHTPHPHTPHNREGGRMFALPTSTSNVVNMNRKATYLLRKHHRKVSATLGVLFIFAAVAI